MSQTPTEPYVYPPNSQNLTGFPSPNNKTIGTPREPGPTNHTYSTRKPKGRITRFRFRSRSRSRPKYNSKTSKTNKTRGRRSRSSSSSSSSSSSR